MNLQISVVIGTAFGLLAAACAYLISYAEYRRNWSFRGSAARMALRSAAVTFVFFLLAAIALGVVFRMVAI
jgi:hypothetical protein